MGFGLSAGVKDGDSASGLDGNLGFAKLVMAESYWITCPGCGYCHRVVPAQAGKDFPCSCGQRITVPPLRELRTLPPAQEEPTVQISEKPRWDIPKMISLVGIFVFLAGIAVAGVFWWTWPRPLPVRQMTPAQTWDLWQRFQEQGLPRRYIRNDPFVQEMQARRLWMVFAGILCFLGIALILSARWIPQLLQESPPEPEEAEPPEQPEAEGPMDLPGQPENPAELS